MDISKIVTKRNLFITGVGVAVVLITLFSPKSAEAFFGDEDVWGDSVGSFLSDTNGSGKGKGSASGNFSMNINASGEASTYALADVDNNTNTNGGIESHSSGNEDIDEFYRYY